MTTKRSPDQQAAKSETSLVDPSIEWTPEMRVAGSPQREKLLLAHTDLVRFLAHRIGSRLAGSVDIDDLVGDGLIGLMEAADRFDPARGVRFKTYAETRIRGSILDGIRSRDWAPRSIRRAARKLESGIAAVERKKRSSASDEEIASELHMTMDELQQLYMQAGGVKVTSMPHGDDDRTDPVDRGPDPLSQVELIERRGLLAEEIENLPEREKLVLSMYYERGLTLREIGVVLEVTESRVCQIHTRAVARLRARVNERFEAPVGV